MVGDKRVKNKAKKPRKGWRHHVKEWGLIVLIITVVSIAVDHYRTRDMPVVDLPSLAGQTLQGEWIDVLEESKQAPVIVYFWATWCPACKFVTPTVDWFNGPYKVVGVSATSGPAERVEKFMAGKETDFPNLNDPKGEILHRWGITATPTIVIIKDGKIASTTTGVTTPIGLFARLVML
ncbi:protein disulfide oxidoreductase [Vibrio sp. 10N.261.51.F12]|uniref:protein disulfide oxidoreductase n=1 Tax=Vibrio sp. 10N.261.51.F12 TaxID=3229679 RepID=UPI00354FFFDF